MYSVPSAVMPQVDAVNDHMVAVLEQIETPLRRVWAMVSKDTFDVPPIRALVKTYLYQSKVSVDPFARNKRWATYTNDLNPEAAAEYHMESRAFLMMLIERGIKADLVLCDPPYSQAQVARTYESVGKEYQPFGVDNNAVLYREVRDLLDALLLPNGVALSFGWNSVGFGLERGYQIEEILLVCHGGAHNDTICVVERKLESTQTELFIT